MQKLKQSLTFALLIDALAVFILLVYRVDAWLLVCAYWAILAFKSAIDFYCEF